MKPVRRRLTYANVMSSIAVFLVVAGGSALAAGTLGKNTVGTKQLKNNAVTGAKIKNGAVTGAKIGAGAVSASKIDTAGLTVPNATHAVTADTAGKATSATSAGTAASAITAASATVANTAFSVNSGEDILQFDPTAGTLTTVASLNLPAGDYFLLGKVLANNNEATFPTVNCRLVAGAAVIDSGFDDTRLGKDGESDRQYLVVSGVAALSSPTTVNVECDTSATAGNWLDRTLSAIQVKSIG
jgi:hypothetical protein